MASTLEEWLEALPPITNATALRVTMAVVVASMQTLEPLTPMPAGVPTPKIA